MHIESLPFDQLAWDMEVYVPDWDYRIFGLFMYVRLDCPHCKEFIEIATAQYWDKEYNIKRYACDGCYKCCCPLPAEAIWMENCQFIAEGI